MNINNPVTNNAPSAKGRRGYMKAEFVYHLWSRDQASMQARAPPPVIAWDFVPTFCEMLGCVGELPADVEGGSLMPLLLGTADVIKRPGGDALVWHFPHYLTRKGTTPQSAIRVGNYKLIKFYHDEKSELYDLSSDIGETTDLSSELPDVVSELESRLMAYLADIGARLPVENTAYSP